MTELRLGKAFYPAHILRQDILRDRDTVSPRARALQRNVVGASVLHTGHGNGTRHKPQIRREWVFRSSSPVSVVTVRAQQICDVDQLCLGL